MPLFSFNLTVNLCSFFLFSSLYSVSHFVSLPIHSKIFVWIFIQWMSSSWLQTKQKKKSIRKCVQHIQCISINRSIVTKHFKTSPFEMKWERCHNWYKMCRMRVILIKNDNGCITNFFFVRTIAAHKLKQTETKVPSQHRYYVCHCFDICMLLMWILGPKHFHFFFPLLAVEMLFAERPWKM